MVSAVFLRSSKVAYLPDFFGKPQVASIEQAAFPEDTAVLCSKRLFAKLNPENQFATIRLFLNEPSRFTKEEAKYLKEHLKKKSVELFERMIRNDATDLLDKALAVLNDATEMYDACFDIADRLGKPEVRAYLLNLKNVISFLFSRLFKSCLRHLELKEKLNFNS